MDDTRTSDSDRVGRATDHDAILLGVVVLDHVAKDVLDSSNEISLADVGVDRYRHERESRILVSCDTMPVRETMRERDRTRIDLQHATSIGVGPEASLADLGGERRLVRARLDVVDVVVVEHLAHSAVDPLDDLQLEALRVAGLDRDGLDAVLGGDAAQRAVLAAVVEDDLRLEQLGHLGLVGVEHVDTNVVAVDTAEARRVQVDEPVEALDDLLKEVVAEDLGRCAVGLAGERAVEVLIVAPGALEPRVAHDVDARNADHRAVEALDVEVQHQAVNARHAVELVAVHCSRDTEHWTRL